MIAAVSLRLLFLIFQQVLRLVLLMGRKASTKDVELLVLRHEVGVLRRTNPKHHLDWADRAVFAALIRRLPTRSRGHRLVTPGAILRWHRPWYAGSGSTRTGPDAHRSTRPSPPWWSGWRARTRAGDTAECRANCSNWATASAPRRSAESCAAAASHRRRCDRPTPAGGSRLTFVQLGETRDAAVVPSLAARTLGIPAREPVGEHIAAHIGSDRTLLVLDTFEHVLDAAAGVAALLAACPGLVVLATSREPLRLRGEFVFRVDSLAAPAGRPSDMAELETNAAAKLVLERARAACAGLALLAEDPGIVAEICRRLEGLPLALELAVARVRLLPLSALRDQLEHRLPLLTVGLRDGPPRQRTMRETIAWSYTLLGESQQDLVRRLSVFAVRSSISTPMCPAPVPRRLARRGSCVR
jgi:hypothetical protein